MLVVIVFLLVCYSNLNSFREKCARIKALMSTFTDVINMVFINMKLRLTSVPSVYNLCTQCKLIVLSITRILYWCYDIRRADIVQAGEV